ncbi:hypothetical protein [Pedobacter rhodius]|uniref:HTH cro/C1-type domain-containing protein n=1 Tax=Pedobacter rhodius TaxID=3004098 RepID=A0ABT4L188_9SPHI|nr:hypothetical protein [Pedobacter sp. SJ11]MCZ4224940.1 hypothetical protein [Pedobacter sp. SJ11]
MSINKRIKQVIEVKSGGSQKAFAALIEATPQYVARLIAEGGSVGLEPIIKILKLYPDVDARWLILGEGVMISQGQFNEVKYFLHQNIQEMLKIEQFLPYMTDDELKQYKDAATTFNAYKYDSKQLDRWTKLSESHGK